MEIPPSDMTLTELAQHCELELNKFRHKASTDDQYCLEVFYRAIQREDEGAWALLYEQYTETVRVWFRRHNSRDTALRYMKEEDFVDKTFERFWQATRKAKPEFESLASALSYLKLCLSSSMMDELHISTPVNLTPLHESAQLEDPKFEVEDTYHESELWEILKGILLSSKERRLAYLLIYCNLKPREIIRNLPNEFENEAEIYRLRRKIWERVMRSADNIWWQLSDSLSIQKIARVNAAVAVTLYQTSSVERIRWQPRKTSQVNTAITDSYKKESLSLFAIARANLEYDDSAFVSNLYSVQAGVSRSQPKEFLSENFDLSVRNSSEPILFDILLHASENIEIIEAWQHHLRYEPLNPNPQLVTFAFRALAKGQSSLTINFYQKQRWLRTFRLEFITVEQSERIARLDGG